jgi:hypothetical protein
MKKVLILVPILFFGLIALAQPPAGDAKPGDWYGEKITTDGAISMSEVASKLEKEDKVESKFTARIVDVCPKKGCWLKLALDDSTTAMVKMKDYGFFLPVAAIGKTVVIDGEAKIKKTSVAELRHIAEDGKKSKEEIEAITKPEKQISVVAKGIVIVQ